MAKTATRLKAATAKKTEASGSAAPHGAADIRLIPLDQLEPSPHNVRKVVASASDDAELLASVRETGIKQNLVVHLLSETRFAVDAGGRRLKALKQLADDGAISADHPVPCLIEDERNAILTSATENLQRAAMLGSVSQLSCWVARPSWLWARITGHIKEGTWTSGSSVPAAKRGQRLRRRRHHKLVHEVQD